MLDYQPLRPGPGFSPARAAFYYSQRFAVRPGLRRLVSKAIAAGINVQHRQTAGTGAAAPCPSAEVARSLVALARDGYALLDRPRLSGSALAEVLEYLEANELVGPGGRRFKASQAPANASMAAYPLETVLGCPHVLEAVNCPDMLRIAAGYLGCKPTLSSIGIRWSFPQPKARTDVQNFHRDPDDWRFLKFFVYLTDVDAGTGPHEFVAGSHRTAGRLLARPYTKAEIEREHGPDRIRTITGPRGTSFVADTYGIHRGAVPTTGARLILQAQYSLLPVFSFRYKPVSLESAPVIDSYVNRLLVALPPLAAALEPLS
jgi:hypothetical protein